MTPAFVYLPELLFKGECEPCKLKLGSVRIFIKSLSFRLIIHLYNPPIGG